MKNLIEKFGIENMEAVSEALFNQAKKGNIKAINELLNRYYGSQHQGVKYEVNQNAEITLVVHGSRSNLLDQ